MSDELKETQEANPQFRKRRNRNRPQSDLSAVVKAQATALEQLREQNEKLMTLILNGQGGANPLAQFLPEKPQPIPRPTGYIYLLSRKPENEYDDSEKLNTFSRIVPERPDNPNEPDPRYCAFCAKNVALLYGRNDIPGNPSPEQEQALQQLFILHRQDAETKAASKLKGPEGKANRRFGADHLEMKAVRFGRVPDEVAWLKGRSWSSQEYYENQLKIWEAKTRSVGLGMAKGGI